MLEITIPGRQAYHLSHLALDVNGTLARDGTLLPGVAERIAQVRAILDVYLISADTFGQLDAISAQLGVGSIRLQPSEKESEQKAAFLRQLGASSVVAIGNGANDVGMLAEAALAIVVLGPEGLAIEALNAADIASASINDALDLLLSPRRVIATLRR